MNEEMLDAFLDEFVKIKEAAFQINQALPFMGKHLRGIGANLAGTGKALLNPVQGVRQGVRSTVDSFKGSGFGPGLNMTLTGVGTASMIPDVAKKEDPSGKGRSRLARGIAAAGNIGGGIIGAPFGLSGGIAGSVAGEVAGRSVGKVTDRLRGIKSVKQAPSRVSPFDASSPSAATSPQSTTPSP